MSVKETDRGWSAISAAIRRAGDAVITVGVHASESAPGDGGATSTAAVGAIHEFGVGVPQRAWLAPSIDDHADELMARARDLYLGPLLSGTVGADQALGLIGERMQQIVQQRLREKDPSWPPLSAATKRNKARTVRGGSKRASFAGGHGNPLIDTGQLIQSVRYRVSRGAS